MNITFLADGATRVKVIANTPIVSPTASHIIGSNHDHDNDTDAPQPDFDSTRQAQTPCNDGRVLVDDSATEYSDDDAEGVAGDSQTEQSDEADAERVIEDSQTECTELEMPQPVSTYCAMVFNHKIISWLSLQKPYHICE